MPDKVELTVEPAPPAAPAAAAPPQNPKPALLAADPPRRRLSPKMRVFVQRYTTHYNATQAYVEAYGSKNRDSARSAAARLLATDSISEEIRQHHLEVAARAELTQAEVLLEADTLATSDALDMWDTEADSPTLKPMKDWPLRARRALAGLKVKRYPERLPPITRDRLQRLEEIANGVGYDFDITRAISFDDQAWLRTFIQDLRRVYWHQYEILEFKLWDKNAAIEKSMKHRGMFTRHEGKEGDEEEEVLVVLRI